ncbi:ABC transporter permease [Nakamurella endophytica]|uniref:Sugar ABC transporter permease n=1 Tax=Nakamurella endophytica TaxID=1748367 RepID=A0A917SZG4_9ACTN|nr:ABC transporter permease [Nakamurella endophytica]GGM04910.1 sugar ABC transporter permease [Nakamurella endophytica]
MTVSPDARGVDVNAPVPPDDESTTTTGLPSLSTQANTLTTGPVEPESPELRAAQRARLRRRLFGSTPLLMAGVLILIFLVFTVAHPGTFPAFGNVRNMIDDTSLYLIMGVGFTFVMIAAGFDLSQGSVLVFGQVIAAKVMVAVGGQGGWTVAVGFVAAILGGAVWGVFNGLVITRLRVPPLITTLGSLGAALGVANLLTQGQDNTPTPAALTTLSAQLPWGMSWRVWVALLVAVVAGLYLHLTRFGRRTFVIGSNEEAARRSGINVKRHVVKLYVISAALAGLAGMMALINNTTTTVGGHSTDSLTVVTGVALGGVSLFGGSGLMVGTVIGMFVPTVLSNGLISIHVQPFWQQVATGFILVLAVYLDQFKRRRRDRV